MRATTSERPTRRAIIGAIAAGASAAAMSGSGSVAQTASEQKIFVLVHGAWHGGWCWRRVSDLLERGGHKVFAPTMTGLGERSHLLDGKINVSTHVTDIVNVMKWENLTNVVLVGHSYGGFVISGVAEKMQGAIASLVYLDAFVPQSGDSLAELASPRVRENIQAAVQKGDPSMPAPKAAFFQVNEKDRAWVDEKCTPHPVGTFSEQLVLTGARERVAHKTYIRAKGYATPAFDAIQAKLKNDPTWRVHEMPCGHDAMVDMPERLVELLLEASA
jgi:pimeloyl-ACP methyl ester carboxylesterase